MSRKRRLKSGCGGNNNSACWCILFIGVLCILYELEGSEYIGLAEVNQSKVSTRNMPVYLVFQEAVLLESRILKSGAL